MATRRRIYRVMQDGEPVGILPMTDVVRALVPTDAAEGGLRAAS